ncbi:MAG TPA: hypothetical protein ENJ19_03385 [Gammaproteobacteria bacterium]|nr:hypothetical protein [Gammaproteobacteria bacterium]
MTAQRVVFAKFLGQDIFLEQGRLLFSLFHAFVTSGYQVMFFDHTPEGGLEEYGRAALELDGVTKTTHVPANGDESLYLFDEEDPSLAGRPWRRKIKVDFDVFSPYWLEPPIIMPFPMHPVHAMRGVDQRLETFREGRKNKRVFFSGDTKDYRRNRVRYPKPKLPRLKIVNIIRERMSEDTLVVDDLAVLDGLGEAGYTNKCVLVDTDRIWVDDKIWPDMLATADFFLAPPGIVMPMCHNIVEAMAVGCVPITNYPEWFDPALTPMENCIAFDGEDDLLAKLRLALRMPVEQIRSMRAKVLSYYERYLRPANFIRRVEDAPQNPVTVLLITEKNMARRPKKLGRWSVLIKGTVNRGNERGLRRALSLLLE